MPTFALLTTLSGEASKDPERMIELSNAVRDEVRQTCQGVRWLDNYLVLGPYDYIDIFEAPDASTAAQVSMIIRSQASARTETLSVVPWEEFKERNA